MKIDDDHMHHGAALIQIAEDPRFTAINSFKLASGVSRSAYRINDDIGVYLKYATKPTPTHREYQFTFRPEHLAELREITAATRRTFVALVCVRDRHVCCLAHEDLIKLVAARKKAKGATESQYVILVTLPAGKNFRVYVNAPGFKNQMLDKPVLVSRSDFPREIFR